MRPRDGEETPGIMKYGEKAVKHRRIPVRMKKGYVPKKITMDSKPGAARKEPRCGCALTLPHPEHLVHVRAKTARGRIVLESAGGFRAQKPDRRRYIRASNNRQGSTHTIWASHGRRKERMDSTDSLEKRPVEAGFRYKEGAINLPAAVLLRHFRGPARGRPWPSSVWGAPLDNEKGTKIRITVGARCYTRRRIGIIGGYKPASSAPHIHLFPSKKKGGRKNSYN